MLISEAIMLHTLKDTLVDWTDVDGAQHSLARCLGLIGDETSFQRAKHVYWTNNPICDFLYDVLLNLSELGVLERHPDDELRFRWNAAYRGSWQKEWKKDS